MTRIGILTGGGDCPGLNAVIRAVVKRARGDFGWAVTGIEDGFAGLMGPEVAVRELDVGEVVGPKDSRKRLEILFARNVSRHAAIAEASR